MQKYCSVSVVDNRVLLTTTVMDEFYGDKPSLANFFDSLDLLGLEWEMQGR